MILSVSFNPIVEERYESSTHIRGLVPPAFEKKHSSNSHYPKQVELVSECVTPTV
jgi:hypothetical protein